MKLRTDAVVMFAAAALTWVPLAAVNGVKEGSAWTSGAVMPAALGWALSDAFTSDDDTDDRDPPKGRDYHGGV